MRHHDYPMNNAWLAFERTRLRQESDHARFGSATSTIKPVDIHTSNPLRPWLLQDVIGQRELKDLLRRIIDVAKARNEPLDHVLLTGAAGTGKTTMGYVVAHELGTQVYQLEAPVTAEQLLELRSVMHDRDVLIVDEVHRQVVTDRRGVGSTAGAEVMYHLMEDRTLVTETGVIDFPAITLVACTTDEGKLPPSFLDRFPLQPKLRPYSDDDMIEIAEANGKALDIEITPSATVVFADAARGNPRIMNRYVKNALSLNRGRIDAMLAVEVVSILNSTTADGLNADMQGMLTFVFQHGRREGRDGTVAYQASLDNIATALGKSRVTQSVALYVEPYLIQCGFVTVQPRGRTLTDTGIQRAKELLSC